jgi:hypothetical protein
MASIYSVTAQSSATRSLRGSSGARTTRAGSASLAWLLLLLGCSSDWVPIEAPRIEGMAHKGPLLRESLVTATLFSAPGIVGDQSVTTHTLSDLGDYRLELPRPPLRAEGGAMGEESAPKPVWLRAQGAFFNEATATASKAHIALDGLALLPDAGTHQVHVNLLTHLSFRRSLALWQGGMAPQLAIARAEDELRQVLHLAWPAGKPLVASQLSLLSQDEDERSYLWAATLRVIVAAHYGPTTLGASSEERLLALIALTEGDFASQGVLRTTLQAQYSTAWSHYSPAAFVAPLLARLAASGADLTAPDLGRSLDYDGDGFADGIDTCPLLGNPNQAMQPLGVCSITLQELRQPESIEPTAYFGLDVVDAAGRAHAIVLNRAQVKDLDSESDAQGTFAPFVEWLAPPGGPSRALLGFNALSIGDRNGDGATDVLATSTGGTVPEGLYLSSQPAGFGQFVKTTPYPYVTVGGAQFRGLASPSGATSVAVADFDGNGLRDLAGVTTDSSGARRIALQLQSSPGTWDAPLLPIAPPSASAQIRSVVTGDLNGDGNADLVCSGSFGVQVLLGNGRASFSALPTVPACVSLACPAESTLADFDHDGYLDLFVVATYPALRWAGILYGSASGQLRPPMQVIDTVAIPPPLILRVADINGDGWVDLISQEGFDLSVYLNNKLGFTSPQRLTLKTRTALSTLSIIGARDLDSDGRMELMLLGAMQAEGGRVGVEAGVLRLGLR